MIAAMRERFLVAFVALIIGCQDGSDLADAKRTPKPPPPASAATPAVAIAVEVDAVAGTPIDGARLDAVKPDFSDEGRRTWKMTTLLGDAAKRPGAVIAVSGAGGPEILLRNPEDASKPQPALMATRRGELVATMVSPDDPFPEYHGRGGRLGRSGDSVPRIVGVRRIRVYLER
mgnify:CR=1 FL=1